jgi:phosphoenolpyruvate carboxylase
MDSRRQAVAPDFTRSPANPAGKPAGSGSPDAADRQRDVAEYIAEMVLELRNLARNHRLYTVMVPLEYAYYEAFGVAHRVEVTPDEIERIKELSRASEVLEQPPQAG